MSDDVSFSGDPGVSVVVCSYNGASRLPRCLEALERQTIRSLMEVIVVDDCSRDETSRVAESLGARVLRLTENRGPAAARNAGIRLARGRLVLFADDDVVAADDWAERLVDALGPDAVAVGGELELMVAPGLIGGYLRRNSPFAPLEFSLDHDDGLLRRLVAYLASQWSPPPTGRRYVFAVPIGSFACRRDDLLAVGLLDEGLASSEDHDLCWRLRERFPERKIVFEPAARATHVTESSLRSVLRRSRWYGRGSGDLLVSGRVKTPTLFFSPLLAALLIVASIRHPRLLLALIIGPQLLFPRGAVAAVASRRPGCVLDPYIEIGCEAAHTLGFGERLTQAALAHAGRLVSGTGRTSGEAR